MNISERLIEREPITRFKLDLRVGHGAPRTELLKSIKWFRDEQQTQHMGKKILRIWQPENVATNGAQLILMNANTVK